MRRNVPGTADDAAVPNSRISVAGNTWPSRLQHNTQFKAPLKSCCSMREVYLVGASAHALSGAEQARRKGSQWNAVVSDVLDERRFRHTGSFSIGCTTAERCRRRNPGSRRRRRCDPRTALGPCRCATNTSISDSDVASPRASDPNRRTSSMLLDNPCRSRFTNSSTASRLLEAEAMLVV